MGKFLCALTLLFASRISLAGESALYAGFSLGDSPISFNSQDFGSGSPSNAKERTTIGRDTAYRFFIGYPLDDTWAIEGGYAHQGRFQYRSKDIDSYDSVFDYRASSWFLAGKGTLPLTGTIAVFAKLGLTVNTAKIHYWVDSSHALALPIPAGFIISEPNLASHISPGSYSYISTAPLLGVGVEYTAGANMKIRLEYENYGEFGGQTTTGRANINMTSLGVSYMF